MARYVRPQSHPQPHPHPEPHAQTISPPIIAVPTNEPQPAAQAPSSPPIPSTTSRTPSSTPLQPHPQPPTVPPTTPPHSAAVASVPASNASSAPDGVIGATATPTAGALVAGGVSSRVRRAGTPKATLSTPRKLRVAARATRLPRARKRVPGKHVAAAAAAAAVVVVQPSSGAHVLPGAPPVDGPAAMAVPDLPHVVQSTRSIVRVTKKQISLTLLQKKKICQQAERMRSNGDKPTCAFLAKWARREFRVPVEPSQPTISRILQNAHRLNSRDDNIIRKRKRIRHGKNHAVEVALIEWLTEQRKAGKEPKGHIICEKGRQLQHDMNRGLAPDRHVNLTFSDGWLNNFRIRWCLKKSFEQTANEMFPIVKLPPLEEQMRALDVVKCMAEEQKLDTQRFLKVLYKLKVGIKHEETQHVTHNDAQ